MFGVRGGRSVKITQKTKRRIFFGQHGVLQRQRGCRGYIALRREEDEDVAFKVRRRLDPQILCSLMGGSAVEDVPLVQGERRQPSEGAVIIYLGAGAVPTATCHQKV